VLDCGRRDHYSRHPCVKAKEGIAAARADVISSALFGDDAMAVVLRREPEKKTSAVQIGAAAQGTCPNTLDIMGWTAPDSLI
jgi:predicted naringenin-chalcone synthase